MKLHKFLLFPVVLLGLAMPAFASCPGPSCPSGMSVLGPSVSSADARPKPKVSPRRATAGSKKRIIRKGSVKPSPSLLPVSIAQPNIWLFLDIKTQNRLVQIALKRKNFDVGTIDGTLGKRAQLAIKKYQKEIGSAETGELTPDQLVLLRNFLWADVKSDSQLNGENSVFPSTVSSRTKARDIKNIGTGVFR